jgi:plastocyanin
VTDHAHEDGTAPAAGPNGRWRMVLLGLVLLMSAGALLLVVQSQLATELVRVEVAAGTAERLAAGEPIELLPPTLEVAVGDRLEIVNDDHVTHQVGPYTVAPGQILRQSFTSPGTLEGACTLHPSGAIRIVVR